MNEIKGTLTWSLEQIKAYAAAFREGDAVRVGDDWVEVKEIDHLFKGIEASLDVKINPYRLNYITYNRRNGITDGFGSLANQPYKIIMPKDYEIQKGDKLVWLGKTQKQGNRSEFTFGKVYEVFLSEDGSLIYKNDMTIMLLASYLKEKSSMWGVIPKWSNVKGKEKTRKDFKFSVGDMVRVVEDSSLDKFDRDYIGKFGVITDVDNTSSNLPYAIKFDSRINLVWFEGCALELAEKEKGKGHERKTELVDEVVRSRKFKVGDIVEVVGEANKHYISQSGVVVFVDCYDDKLPYEVDFLEDSVWLNDKSLRKVGESFIASTPKASTPKAEYTTKIKTIQGSVGQLESFDERVNEFMQDKDIVDVSHSFVTDISGLENIIAVITYRCSKTEE